MALGLLRRVDHEKGAPDQERSVLLRDMSDQIEEHLSGETRYRVLSAGPRRHEPVCGVGQAGGVLLAETVRASGLDATLSAGLGRWRKPTAVHDPAKVLL